MSQGMLNRFRSSKVVHTVENGFCTVCSETEDWLTLTGQECTNRVPAAEVPAAKAPKAPSPTTR